MAAVVFIILFAISCVGQSEVSTGHRGDERIENAENSNKECVEPWVSASWVGKCVLIVTKEFDKMEEKEAYCSAAGSSLWQPEVDTSFSDYVCSLRLEIGGHHVTQNLSSCHLKFAFFCEQKWYGYEEEGPEGMFLYSVDEEYSNKDGGAELQL